MGAPRVWDGSPFCVAPGACSAYTGRFQVVEAYQAGALAEGLALTPPCGWDTYVQVGYGLRRPSPAATRGPLPLRALCRCLEDLRDLATDELADRDASGEHHRLPPTPDGERGVGGGREPLLASAEAQAFAAQLRRWRTSGGPGVATLTL